MKNGEIICNRLLQGDYFEAEFFLPEICREAKPGQFVHLMIAENQRWILRRPFSIHDVNSDGILSIAYKVVGQGTKYLSQLPPGAVCDALGPLGSGFTPPQDDEIPVLVAGGYGAAATYLLAKNSRSRGVLLLGAKCQNDLILTDKYHQCNYDVRIATDDGSCGKQGYVTELLAETIRDYAGQKLKFYGCGPSPMLMALANYLQQNNLTGEVSLDHLMCCGIGACFSCVVKVKDDTNDDGWRYARSCNEGPVFDAATVYTGK